MPNHQLPPISEETSRCWEYYQPLLDYYAGDSFYAKLWLEEYIEYFICEVQDGKKTVNWFVWIKNHYEPESGQLLLANEHILKIITQERDYFKHSLNEINRTHLEYKDSDDGKKLLKYLRDIIRRSQNQYNIFCNNTGFENGLKYLSKNPKLHHNLEKESNKI